MPRPSGGSPGPRQLPFGRGQATLSTGLCLPLAFRRVALASWTILCPLQGWAGLAAGLLACRQTATGLPRSATVRDDGGRCLLYSGALVSAQEVSRPPCQSARYCRKEPSFRQPAFTEPPRRFISIHPSHLSLSRLARMVRTSLGGYPWLRTSPLPGRHAGIGNRQGHSPRSCDHSPIATSCRTT